ncbi:MAG: DUF1622 domain-containing protein [Candidatus ainarchaeum sp.]|nr:DUF1622 domain-containing protein [Candidatus ainarchaeum sp.]
MLPAEIAYLLDLATVLIASVGVIILIYGVAHAVYRLVRAELFLKQKFREYEHIKRILIQKIIFALDFFVAADLIRLMVAVTLDELTSIALIVAIRTVLSWSLSREVQLHEE